MQSPLPATEASEILQIITTVGSEADASRLAEQLIQRRLAACVQIDATIHSVYAWKGETCRDPEWRLVIKTMASRWTMICQVIDEIHPYELPELIGQTMPWATPAYRQWVAEQVQA
ncbi:MAG: divalent-cation tolerance protein CutA [Pirellulaceae bacterium]